MIRKSGRPTAVDDCVHRLFHLNWCVGYDHGCNAFLLYFLRGLNQYGVQVVGQKKFPQIPLYDLILIFALWLG